MSADPTTSPRPAEAQITVTSSPGIPPQMADYAVEKLGHLAQHERSPILFGEVKLTLEPNPARERPAKAEGVFDVDGVPVRAHVAAHDLAAAIDLLEDRLGRRLERQRHLAVDRARRHRVLDDHEWRHGDPPTHRPEYFDRSSDDRRLVRRKTFTVGEMTCDEAADTLDLLGHDFLLFTNLETGADAVISYAGDQGLELIDVSEREDAVGGDTVAPVRLSRLRAPTCPVAEAVERLDLDVEPFVFFVEPESGRGNVVYRRYDGHYGLITPA